MSPYTIEIDRLSKYNYLVGYGSEIQADGSLQRERMVSFRISNIKQLRIMNSKSGRMTKDKQKQLKQALFTKGPQFLNGNTIEVIAKFTNKGIDRYYRHANMRPTYTEKLDEHTFVFHCPEHQAHYYFFSFGNDVTILSPRFLREQFKNQYR